MAAAGSTNSNMTPTTSAAGYPTTLQQALPGLNNLLGSATGNISNLLSGLPSASWAQTTNAYAGAGAGQPGQANAIGTFSGNMGANLYNQQANQNRQTGLSDLLNLIGTSSGNLATTPGQNLQNTQFQQNLGQNSSQFQQSLAEQQFMDQINALIGLSNAGFGGTGGITGGYGTATAPQAYGYNVGNLAPPNGYNAGGTAYYGGGAPVNPISSLLG